MKFMTILKARIHRYVCASPVICQISHVINAFMCVGIRRGSVLKRNAVTWCVLSIPNKVIRGILVSRLLNGWFENLF